MELRVGDKVRVEEIPDWLLKGLPSDEQAELRSYVGQVLRIESIDEHGYLWLGAGHTRSAGDTASYRGHSFALKAANVKRV